MPPKLDGIAYCLHFLTFLPTVISNVSEKSPCISISPISPISPIGPIPQLFYRQLPTVFSLLSLTFAHFPFDDRFFKTMWEKNMTKLFTEMFT